MLSGPITRIVASKPSCATCDAIELTVMGQLLAHYQRDAFLDIAEVRTGSVRAAAVHQRRLRRGGKAFHIVNPESSVRRT
jgi:hypothetical protein